MLTTKDLLEKGIRLQDLLINRATGRSTEEEYREYLSLRNELLSNPRLRNILQSFLQECRSLDQFWGFIQLQFPGYQERRVYIWKEFHLLLSQLEAELTGAVSDTAKSATIDTIERIARHFPAVARQLLNRHANRETLEINDEYDVQDLFHAILRLYFDDIRSEEWTPSYAGGGSRVDFLLKAEHIVIEIKKTRLGLKAKTLGDQLAVDITRYRSHPACNVLIAFVYDPDRFIDNPKGIEIDLSTSVNDMLVRVFIVQG